MLERTNERNRGTHAFRTRRAKLGFQLGQTNGILAEDALFLTAILQAGKVCIELRTTPVGEAVNHPSPTSLGSDHASAAQVGQVTRNLHLRRTQCFLQVTNTQGAIQQKMYNAQTS